MVLIQDVRETHLDQAFELYLVNVFFMLITDISKYYSSFFLSFMEIMETTNIKNRCNLRRFSLIY